MRRMLIAAAAMLFSAAFAQEHAIADNGGVPADGATDERPFPDPRTSILPNGMTFRAAVKSDLLSVVSGGLRRGAHSIAQADLITELDGRALAGFTGARMVVQFMMNSGGGLNTSSGEMQLASNIEAYRTMRLYQCWLEQELPDLGLSFLAGLFDLNSEFYVTASSGLFLNSSFGIGADLGQTGRNGPSIFPSTSLAFRIRYDKPGTGSFSAALFDGTPGARDDAERFGIAVSEDDGYLAITEISIAAGEGSHISGSLWRYTAPFEDICAVADPVLRRDNNGAYLLAEHSILPGWTGEDELHLFFRGGIANGHLNAFHRHIGTGVVYEFGDGDLVAGYAVAVAELGEDFSFQQQQDGIPSAASESVHEFTISRRLTGWLTVQGDLQYIVHPSARRDIGNVLIGGARIIISSE